MKKKYVTFLENEFLDLFRSHEQPIRALGTFFERFPLTYCRISLFSNGGLEPGKKFFFVGKKDLSPPKSGYVSRNTYRRDVYCENGNFLNIQSITFLTHFVWLMLVKQIYYSLTITFEACFPRRKSAVGSTYIWAFTVLFAKARKTTKIREIRLGK